MPMNFKENKAIFMQIADKICDDILSGQTAEEERIPSVRAFAAEMEVNSNTVMKAYDYLSDQAIVYNKRGIGFFISKGAREKIETLRRNQFMENELEDVFRQLNLLDVTPEMLKLMYKRFRTNNPIK